MVDQPINGGHGGHWILEDLVPFGKDEIGTDHEAAPFIALGQEGEEHLHFFAALLNVPDVVEGDDFEAIQVPERLLQTVDSFGLEQTAHELEGRHKEDAAVMAQNQLTSERGQEMRLAPARGAGHTLLTSRIGIIPFVARTCV